MVPPYRSSIETISSPVRHVESTSDMIAAIPLDVMTALSAPSRAATLRSATAPSDSHSASKIGFRIAFSIFRSSFVLGTTKTDSCEIPVVSDSFVP